MKAKTFAVLIIIMMSLTMSGTVLAVATASASTPTPNVDYFVDATAGPGGTISPSGTGFFAYPGSSFNFIITPDAGYQILDVTDNGFSKGALQRYDLWNIQTSHKIFATFIKIAQTSTPTPITQTLSPAPILSSSPSPSGSQSAGLFGLGWMQITILALINIIVAAVVVSVFVFARKKRNSR